MELRVCVCTRVCACMRVSMYVYMDNDPKILIFDTFMSELLKEVEILAFVK